MTDDFWMKEAEAQRAIHDYRHSLFKVARRATGYEDSIGRPIIEGDIVLCIDKYYKYHKLYGNPVFPPDVVIEDEFTDGVFDLATNSDKDANYLYQFATLGGNYEIYVIGNVVDNGAEYPDQVRLYLISVLNRLRKALKGGQH